MGSKSKIEWTDHTFNPWWGCTKVSPGCAHCYADAFAKRTGHPVWGPDALRRFFPDPHWRAPLTWNAAARDAAVRRRVFCASMADVFEDRPDLVEPRARLFDLIGRTTWLDWLLLTKRPENIGRLWLSDVVAPNVWYGTTVEDQARADERIPQLLAVPAAVRFLSVEPLLGPVDLRPYLDGSTRWSVRTNATNVDWVIVGGESGPGARPCDVAWIRSIVDRCIDAGVPVFVKQIGAFPVTANANLDDWPDDAVLVHHGEGAAAGRAKLRDPKGGDPAEWPEDLRVREFPRGYAS